ncbi:MAG: NAD(P)/FAD-dependent oxidoreductase [Gammaproteobacteria bacterium]|nr:NAD(P)/FAD-dependent oxidoreductase [Gammaproteobacteria bacterium]
MTTDAIIVGGGHNGLVCAGYLAKNGIKVKVIEKNHQVGGPASTEEFHPGFRNSVGAYTVSLLNPKVIKDLDLHQHGLTIVERKVNNLFPQPDGNFLAFVKDRAGLKREIAQFSQHDAEQLDRYFDDISMVSDQVRAVLLETPPNAGGGIKDLLKTALLGNRLRRLSVSDGRILLDIFTKSVAEFLDYYFDDERVKAAFAFDGLVGTYGDTNQVGTAYVLIHHAFGEVNGKQGVWGHALGGMGAISQAMASYAQSQGVEIEVNCGVRRVVVENGIAKGVELDNGEILQSTIVVSNLNPSLLFNEMLAQEHLPRDFALRMKNYKNGSGTLRMNVALRGLPEFTCLKNQTRATSEHLTSGIVLGPTMTYLNKAYHDAQRSGWSQEPIIEMLIPSTLDDSLAPPDQHVASLFCHQFNPATDWDTHRDQAVETVLNQVEKFAPGFRKLILGQQVLTPLDLERKFGLIGGDIFHGKLSLDQMFSARPILGHGDYSSPIQNLYMCGSGTHPGGGVTGVPGHNAAREILKDL